MEVMSAAATVAAAAAADIEADGTTRVVSGHNGSQLSRATCVRKALAGGGFANEFLQQQQQMQHEGQGLTVVHFSAQLERFFWDRGCA